MEIHKNTVYKFQCSQQVLTPQSSFVHTDHCSLYVFVRYKHVEFTCFCVQGYSFMAPSILFKRNVVMDDHVQLCGGSERPGSAAVARSAMMKVR